MSSLPPPLFDVTPLVSRGPVGQRAPLPRDASWMSLVAHTTWGMADAECHRVVVKQKSSASPEAELRLIVQSYRIRDLAGGRPGPYARPLASTQRAVQGDELASGIQLDLVQFDEVDDEVSVIAWTEVGQPDLDYDGLEARPPHGAHLARVSPTSS